MSSNEFEGPEERDEWRRQELARQVEGQAVPQAKRHTDRHTERQAAWHTGAPSGDLRGDMALAKYRLIDRALRAEHDGLPENFAARTAALVEATSRAASDRLEAWLERAGIAALVLAAIVSVFVIGGPALAAFAALPGTAWAGSVALCVGLSLALQHLGKQRRSASQPPGD